jgi:HK97 family phage prohead protease
MSVQKIERRNLTLPIELRKKSESADAPKMICGYAARYFDPADLNTQYQLWTDTFERLMPGCFASAIARADDVRCLFNHDPNQILGRSTSGTCRLTVDDKGLSFEVDLPNSPAGQTVAEAITRGDITGCSFSFDVITAEWTEDASKNSEIWYRNITDVRLYDVGPVTFPAYAATDIEMCSARSSFDLAKSSRSIPNGIKLRRWRHRLS